MGPSRSTPARLLVALTLILSCIAQSNNGSTSPSTCGPAGTVNSTGTVDFEVATNPSEDWSLSVTLNQSWAGTRLMYDFTGYLSFPESSTAKYCAFAYEPITASTSSSGENSCEGVLSDKCIDFLRKTSFTTQSDLQCEPPLHSKDCSKLGSIGYGTFATDLSEENCTLPSPPGVSIPESHRAIQLVGIGLSDEPDNSASYDLHVRQVMPWVITTSSGGDRTDAHVVCVSPNDAVNGSRGSAENDASCRSWQMSGKLAKIVAFAVIAAHVFC